MRKRIGEPSPPRKRLNDRTGDAVRNKRLLLWALAVIITVGFFPVSTVVVPEWRVRVVDERGAPVKGIVVRQSWQHYSLEMDGNEEDLVTGGDGYVTFPRREIKSGLFSRAFVVASNALMFREHASFGPSASVTVWGAGGRYASARYEPHKPLPEQLVLPPPT